MSHIDDEFRSAFLSAEAEEAGDAAETYNKVHTMGWTPIPLTILLPLLRDKDHAPSFEEAISLGLHINELCEYCQKGSVRSFVDVGDEGKPVREFLVHRDTGDRVSSTSGESFWPLISLWLRCRNGLPVTPEVVESYLECAGAHSGWRWENSD